MLRITMLSLLFVFAQAHAGVITLEGYRYLEIPITPFSNMASGYQATNPGFRAVLHGSSGEFIAGGPLTMDAVIRGYSDDASQGSAYGQLVLRVEMTDVHPDLQSGNITGSHRGKLSICMARDADSAVRQTQCKNLSGNIHPDRPFQWIDKSVDFQISNGNVKITRYYGSTGDGGTSRQLSLAIYHPAYGFAAPGKAFKDYQSPLVLDLNHNKKLDLVNVWADKPIIRFDLNGTGKVVRTGWVHPMDGLLFWNNGSGCVQNGTQFFGEFTQSKTGERTYKNGFHALAKLLDPENTGLVTVAKHKKLLIWQDKDQNGVCIEAEVQPASRYAKKILLSYKTHKKVALNEDNEVRLTGHYIGNDGKKHLIGDVWFKQRRNENTVGKAY